MKRKPIREFKGAYDFLSNFYEQDLIFEGEIYPTAEHAFQACKTDDPREKWAIRLQETPGKAKRYGRNVELRGDWESVKADCMFQVLKAKFKVPSLREKLLATEDAELIEGNAWGDHYWGKVKYKNKWVGQNMLGKLLMILRDDIRSLEAGICEHDH